MDIYKQFSYDPKQLVEPSAAKIYRKEILTAQSLQESISNTLKRSISKTLNEQEDRAAPASRPIIDIAFNPSSVASNHGLLNLALASESENEFASITDFYQTSN